MIAATITRTPRTPTYRRQYETSSPPKQWERMGSDPKYVGAHRAYMTPGEAVEAAQRRVMEMAGRSE